MLLFEEGNAVCCGSERMILCYGSERIMVCVVVLEKQ